MREEALSSPDLYSNVRVLSRHALEVEQSLQKGTEKANSLSHLVQPRKQGMLSILIVIFIRNKMPQTRFFFYLKKICFFSKKS